MAEQIRASNSTSCLSDQQSVGPSRPVEGYYFCHVLLRWSCEMCNTLYMYPKDKELALGFLTLLPHSTLKPLHGAKKKAVSSFKHIAPHTLQNKTLNNLIRLVPAVNLLNINGLFNILVRIP